MGVQLKPARSKSDLKDFVDLVYHLYGEHPYWVPPLRHTEFQSFSQKKNPAFEHCQVKLWIATNNHRAVGRIAGIINVKENQDAPHKWARFGWFDFEDDITISRRLIDEFRQWARANGCTRIKGPYGFSNTDKAGILTFGYDELPTMAESYNYPYYPKHMEQLGLEKLVDLKSFVVEVPPAMPERVSNFAKLILNRYHLNRAPIQSKKDLESIGFEIFDLLNIVYADLEGYVSHSPHQIRRLVREYARLANPDFLSVVRNRSNDVVAFGVTMPSFSKALQKCKGRLYPFGFLRLLQAMHKNDRADLYLIGVHPEYKQKGLTAIIFEDIIQTFIRYGIKEAETNPEMESNQQVQNLWKNYQIRHHKTRRCYQQTL